jgi:formate dehydrogenase beta subunit
MNPSAATIATPDFVDYEHYRGHEGYRLLQDCLAGRRDAVSVLQALERAGLQDFAGSAGPAAGKWRAVLASPAPRRAVVRVGDASPAQMRDRMLLEADPHRFLEGLLIACWATGITEAIVQIDDLHLACREMLEQELDTLVQEMPIGGLTPIRLGPAASSLQATLELEAETLYWVREICEKGGSGLRWYAVSGRVREPGLKLAPAGSTAAQLIDEHAGGLPSGQRLYAFVCGGSAAGSILPASQASAALDGGGVCVLSDRDSAVDAARDLLQAFVREARSDDELRAVASRVEALIARPQWSPALLAELCGLLRGVPSASACVRMAANTVGSVSAHFGPEVR